MVVWWEEWGAFLGEKYFLDLGCFLGLGGVVGRRRRGRGFVFFI